MATIIKMDNKTCCWTINRKLSCYGNMIILIVHVCGWFSMLLWQPLLTVNVLIYCNISYNASYELSQSVCWWVSLYGKIYHFLCDIFWIYIYIQVDLLTQHINFFTFSISLWKICKWPYYYYWPCQGHYREPVLQSGKTAH